MGKDPRSEQPDSPVAADGRLKSEGVVITEGVVFVDDPEGLEGGSPNPKGSIPEDEAQ